jgi:methanogenic corrinoid protein MtbC1
MAGWRVEDLGNDVPRRPVSCDRAAEAGASVIGVSAMMRTNALNIAAVREEIDRRGLTARVKLAVGGAIFASEPRLVAEVGGDGTCANAMEAPALFERLLATIPR